MPVGPRRPSIATLETIASRYGISLDAEEAESYREVMQGVFNVYRRIDSMTEDRPQTKYPRTPGYRPGAEENPYNAWYWKTSVPGAREGVLKGLRVGLKDTVCLAGVPMMNGSRTLEGFIPDIDATLVTRILDAGGEIAGKCMNSDLCGPAGGHEGVLGPVRNPHDPARSPGGSSSGSAAAIAAGDIPLAIGGDQGGSIRIPAAWCGTSGMKATYGLVPYTGCMGMEASLDHIGPMADSVENLARLLTAVAGPDPLDPRSRGIPEGAYEYVSALDQSIEGLRIGVLKEGFGHSEDTWGDIGLPASESGVDEKVRAAVDGLKAQGATVEDVSVPEHIEAVYILFAILEEGVAAQMLRGNSTGHGWIGFYDTRLLDTFARGWRTQANDLPPPIKTILFVGEYMHENYHGHYYAKSQNMRARIRRAYDAALERYDVLVMPTLPFTATPIPENDSPIGERMFYALNMVHNVCQFNLTGHPALTVPCGMVDGLPAGIQFVGRHLDEAALIRAGKGVEALGDWKKA